MFSRSSSFVRPRRDHVTLLGTMTACLASGASLPAGAETLAADNSDASDQGQVLVTGVRSLVDDKLPGDLHDTPQSVTVVTEQLIKDQAADRLEDALKNVPGITLNAGEGAARGDTVNLRGFSAFNDFFLDGIRDAAIYDRDSFNLESIEVVKGPSAILFGRGSTGGVINQVTKAPTLTPKTVLSVEGGTNSLGRATADVDMPVNEDTAVRVNLMGETSEVAGRDDVQNKRWGVAPSVAWGIGKDDSIVLTYLHQEENNRPDVGIPMVNGNPAPVPRGADFGLLSDRNTADDDIATLRARHEFNDNLSITDTARYANYAFDFQSDMPNLGPQVITPATPLSGILVGRDAPGSSGTQTNLTNQTDLTWRVTTGVISQKIIAGIELSRETVALTRYNNPFNKNFTWVAPTPLLAPNPDAVPPFEPISSLQDTMAFGSAGYITDNISVGPYVDLIVGVRHDRFAASYNQFTSATSAQLHLDHTDDVTSPRAAIVAKPTPTQSYYVSYGTSFDPSAEALALTAKTSNLGPVKAKTYEVGAKTDWLDGRLTATGALFHTEVDNAQTNDPDNPTLTVLNGDQRVQGAEFGLQGYVTKQWEVFAGYTYLDGVTLASGNAAYVGKIMPNVARHAANLWSEYEITDQWEVGGGFNWLGHRFADSAETANLPSYVVWNAMASYKVTDQIHVQLNGINLFNKLYYDNAYYTSTAENHVIPGAGRTVKLNLRLTF